MAKVVVGAEIKVESGQATQSVGSFKKQLKEATEDVVNLSNKFGATSEAAINAAKKVASLKDAIGDAKALADTFNPDKKFVALGGAIQGVTAGFSAYSGAMGLLGSESKEVEKILLKVQSAMALQQGISGIAAAMDSFKMLAGTIKNNVVKAFSTLRNAIISTGVGLLVAGLGLLIANFEKVKQVVMNLIPGLGKVVEFFGDLINSITDFIGVTSEAERATEKLMEATEKSIKSNSEWLDANADKYDKYTQRRLKATFDYQAKTAEIAKDETKTEKEKTDLILQYKEQLQRETVRINADKVKDEKDANDKIAEDAKQAQDKRNAEAKKRAEDAKAAAEEKLKQDEKLRTLRREANEKEQAEVEAFGEALKQDETEKAAAEVQRLYDNNEAMLQAKADIAELNLLEDPDSIENKIAKQQADFELEMAQFEGTNLQRQIAQKQHNDAMVALEQEKKDALDVIKQAEVFLESKKVDAIIGLADTLAEAVGKETAAGKALSVAVTTINTIKGAIAAFTGMTSTFPGPVGIALGVVAAAGVVASGVKAVKQILAVKIPRGGGGGGSAPNISALPKPNLSPQSTNTQLDQGSINAVGNAASSRAFVLETDVTNNQERIRRLNRAARIN
jgi:chemotaxis protein histidine kinase CheA